MTSQHFNDASFMSMMENSSSGLTPFMNTNPSEINPFEAQYSAHTMPSQHQPFGYNLDQASFDSQLLRNTIGRTKSGSGSSSSDKALDSSTKAKSSRSATDPDEVEGRPSEHKRAKFLERNRLAAAKCRTKKKEWANNLEAAARQASQQTRELQAIVQNLRDEVIQYKSQLLIHQDCNSAAINEYLTREQRSNFPEFGPLDRYKQL